jgi:hypothetical protein
MKKRHGVIKLLLTASLLFASLFPSLHATGHLRHELERGKCRHVYGATKTEITHAHESFDNCFVCHFSFSSYIPTEHFTFKPSAEAFAIPYGLSKQTAFISFLGNAGFLRGPPFMVDRSFIV